MPDDSDNAVLPCEAEIIESLPVGRLIYCDEQLDAGVEMSGSVTTKGQKDGQTQSKVTFPGGGSVPGVSIPGDAANRNGLVFEKNLTDGTDSVKSMTWAEVGGRGATGTITGADYKVDQVPSASIPMIAAIKAP